MFPFVYQFNSRIGVLVHYLQMTCFRRIYIEKVILLWLNPLAFSRPLQKRFDTSVLNWLLNHLKANQISHPSLEPVDKSEIQKVYMKCSFDAFQGHVLPLVHNIG